MCKCDTYIVLAIIKPKILLDPTENMRVTLANWSAFENHSIPFGYLCKPVFSRKMR